MSKLTISYMRASTSEERQDISHQRYSIDKFAKANNHHIDREFSEYVSAYKTKANEREELMKVKQLCLEGKVENLYIFEQSRLARNTRDAIDIIDDLTNVNVKIYSAKDGKCINKDRIDKLMNLFTSYFSEQSSEDTSKRIKSQKALAKSKGAFLGHKILFGYTTKEIDGIKKEVVDEDLIPIVKELYSIYLTQGARASMDYLKQYTDRYQTNQTLLQYMSNPKMEQVVGVDVYQDFIIAKANRKQATNNNVKTFRSEVLLEGLLIHESCGGKLSIDYNRGKLVFKCRHCKAKRIEGIKKSFQGEKLTNAVEQELLSILNEKLDKDKLIQAYNDSSGSKISFIEREISNLTNNIKTKEKELDKANINLQKLMLTDLDVNSIEITSNIIRSMRESLDDLKDKLEKNKKELAIEKLRLSKKEELAENLLNFRYLYNQGTAEQKKIIINQIIKRIIVRDTEDFTIELNV